MKFKEGDKVKLVVAEDHREHDQELLGEIGEITKIHPPRSERDYMVDFGHEGCPNCVFYEESLELVKKGRPTKKLPIKYAVFYEENDVDPMKTFTTDKELKKWLEEVKDDEDIDFSSIRVFEVKKELKVKTSFKLVAG